MRHGRMWIPAPQLDSPDRSAGTGQVAPAAEGGPPPTGIGDGTDGQGACAVGLVLGRGIIHP